MPFTTLVLDKYPLKLRTPPPTLVPIVKTDVEVLLVEFVVVAALVPLTNNDIVVPERTAAKWTH